MKKINATLVPLICVWVSALMVGCISTDMDAHAASFDCAKANTKVEHMVCDNPELSKLDEEMAEAYKVALQDEKHAAFIKQAQRRWLKERDGCTNADCLEMTYRGRINKLNPDIDKHFITVLSKNELLCKSYKKYIEWEVNETQKKDRAEYRKTVPLFGTGSLTWYNNPPQCQRPFGEEFSEFSPVKWHEIKPEDYPELAGQAYRYINDWPWQHKVDNWTFKNRSDTAKPLSTDWFKEGEKGMIFQHSNGWVRMWLGEADIDNTGYTVTLLKVDYSRCGYEPLLSTGKHRKVDWQVPVMVVDVTGKKIDTVKSEWILGLTDFIKASGSQFGSMRTLGLQSFDVFNFSGDSYFDQWEGEAINWGEEWTPNKNKQSFGYLYLPKNATLTVHRVYQEKASAVCRFKFNKKAN